MEAESRIPAFSGRDPHPHLGSQLIVVPGKVFAVVGGLAAHKHVPVLKNLFFGQHLVLKNCNIPHDKCLFDWLYSSFVRCFG